MPFLDLTLGLTGHAEGMGERLVRVLVSQYRRNCVRMESHAFIPRVRVGGVKVKIYKLTCFMLLAVLEFSPVTLILFSPLPQSV